MTRKSWGYYASPSLNGRLREHGLRAALALGVPRDGDDGAADVPAAGRGRARRTTSRPTWSAEEMRVVAWLDYRRGRPPGGGGAALGLRLNGDDERARDTEAMRETWETSFAEQIARRRVQHRPGRGARAQRLLLPARPPRGRRPREPALRRDGLRRRPEPRMAGREGHSRERRGHRADAPSSWRATTSSGTASASASGSSWRASVSRRAALDGRLARRHRRVVRVPAPSAR